MKNYKLKTALIVFLALCTIAINAQKNRSINGEGNNISSPELGMATGDLIHHLPPAFNDAVSTPARPGMMNPRRISNMLFQQQEIIIDPQGLNDFAWAFGQFVDHDIVLVNNYPNDLWMTESVFIEVPPEDTLMTPGKLIPIMRSVARPGTGTNDANPRSYRNEITAFIDGSGVYGSDDKRANWLRTLNGGKLKTSKGNLLPWNTINNEFNSPVDRNAPDMADDVGLSTKLFVAGDVRANENPLLTSLHLLFLREHNRLCDNWLSNNPSLSPTNPADDELLYQRARKVVGAILQHIVYTEWLPNLGVDLEIYQGYDSGINPSINNSFSAASFRYGHTMINDEIKRIDEDGNEVSLGHIDLADAFFNPFELLRLDIESYLKGMGVQAESRLDCTLSDAVRNHLFLNNPIFGGLDLAAINIQRGRERGILDYNTFRDLSGMNRRTSFSEICNDARVSGILEDIYENVDNIDPWVGMLAEDAVEGSIFGELLYHEISAQFLALRNGDRYFYLNDSELLDDDMALVTNTSLSGLIMRNTEIVCFQDDAFVWTLHEDIQCFPFVTPVDLKVSISPNPVTDIAFLSMFSSKNASATLRVVNELGQELMIDEVQLKRGENQFRMDLSTIKRIGPYYILIEREDDLTSVKIIKI